MVEPSRKKQKGSASILHFFRTCENESNDEASHVRKQVEDEIFIAEPQPLPQSGGFNQPLPDCCESNESPNAVNIDENPDQLESNSASANAGDECSSLPAMGPYDLGALRTSFSSGALSDQDKYKVLKQFDQPQGYRFPAVSEGRILDYGSGADDEVSSDAETPSQPVPATTTSQPVPATTSQPVPATTSQPVPATTIQPVPATTIQPVPATTIQPVPATTIQPVPATTIQPVPATTIQPVPATTIQPVPATTIQPVPATTIQPVPATTIQPNVPITSLVIVTTTAPITIPSTLPNNLTTPVSRPSPSVDQQASQYTPVPQPPLVPLPSAVLLSPITGGDSPRCLPIREGCNHLPSSDIEKTNLRPPEFTVQCHRNLTTESKIHTLALKLETESYFGPKVFNRIEVTRFSRGPPPVVVQKLLC
ncbi:hypothetical protein EMCRGX_G009654 [Ephydatia muelleri]